MPAASIGVHSEAGLIHVVVHPEFVIQIYAATSSRLRGLSPSGRQGSPVSRCGTGLASLAALASFSAPGPASDEARTRWWRGGPESARERRNGCGELAGHTEHGHVARMTTNV